MPKKPLPPKKKKKKSDVSIAEEMIGKEHAFTSSVLDTADTTATEKKKRVTKKKIVKKKSVKTTRNKKTPLTEQEDTLEKNHDHPEEAEEVWDTEKNRLAMQDQNMEEEDSPEGQEEDSEDGEEESRMAPLPDRKSNFVPSKRALDNIDEQLTEIYKNGDGSLPDMRHFQVKKRHRFFRAFFLFLFTCVLLGAITWVGFFVLQPRTSFSEDDVILSVSGEETVTLGQEIRYRIRYRNAQSVPLSQATLQIRYPNGFVFKESSVESLTDAHDTWALGTIGSDDSGYIDIYGMLYGDVGEDQSFRAFLNYLPANFSSEFQKVATANIQVKDAPVSFVIEGADTIIPGVETTIDLVVRPREEDAGAVSSLAVEIEPGEFFIKKSSSLESDEFYDYRWTVDPSTEETRIQVTGVFLVPGLDAQVSLPIRVIGWADTGRQGDTYVYGAASYEAVVVRQEISVTPVVNGATTNLNVQPGEILNTSVVVRNNGDTPLTDVEVRAVFDVPSFERQSLLDWVEIFDEADGAIAGEQINDTKRRGTITWNSTDVAGLKNIAPGEEVPIDIRIPVKDREDIELYRFVTSDVTLVAEARYTVNTEKELLSSVPIRMTVNTDLSLEIRDDVSRSDENKEVHTIIWLLGNTFHGLTNISLRADVFGNTTFVADRLVTPAGDVVYDADTGSIVWSIDAMPTTVDVLPLQFVLLRNDDNPSQSQLVSKVELHATDEVTGEEIILVGDEIVLGSPRAE